MAIHGFNLDQTRNFENEIKVLRKKLKNDSMYKESVLANEDEYLAIKQYFSEHLRFLQYTFEASIESFYRVRRLGSADPYRDRCELLYPPKNVHHKDRMNNMSSRVLYVSLHEFTAIAETRMDASSIGSYFQLTRFSANRKIRMYKLGQFSEVYKEMPRDSEFVKDRMTEWFGSPHHDSTIQGYAAMECAIADILYDQEDDYHILSSIMADAIFTINASIEAIMYPSVQNRYGSNIAIKRELADKLEITASYVNKLEDVYSNGFYKYQTFKEFSSFESPSLLVFSDVERIGGFRCIYR